MEFVGSLAFFAALALAGVMRWRYVTKPRLAPEDLERIGHEMLSRWRPFAEDIGVPLAVPLDVWRSYEVNNLEALEIARYLIGHGRLTAPNFDIFNIFNGLPPTSVAFTRNSWEECSVKSPGVVVNGPVPVQVGNGNTQLNSGSFNYGDNAEICARLDALALDIYSAADRAGDPVMSAELERAGDTLSSAAANGDASHSRLCATLRWLVDRANDASAEFVSAGIGAAATSLLMSLQ